MSAPAIAVLMAGAGIHITQTVGLVLVIDLADEDQQASVAGLMYVSLLVGSIAAALAFGAFLADFTLGSLIQAIQASAVITNSLNFAANRKQEPLRLARAVAEPTPPQPTFKQNCDKFIVQTQALRSLLAIELGTLAFTMVDILLEPYGGQVLGLGFQPLP
jgi:BCD family chlorophyll transporter-like MFS transporter